MLSLHENHVVMFQYPKGAAIDKYIYPERKEGGPIDLLLILFLGGGIYCSVR